MTKKCSRCKEEKDLKKFGIKRQSKDGLNCYCKDCVNGMMQNEGRSEYRKKYYLEHKEKIDMANKANYEKSKLLALRYHS